MEQKLQEEFILSEFDADNQAELAPYLDSCQNSNVWPYSQNGIYKSFPLDEETVLDQENTTIFNADSIECISNPESVEGNYSRHESVTHIEIIKSTSAVPRRVTGASRVVPSLTSAWQRSNFQACESSITDVYTKFMAVEAGGNTECEECLQEFLSIAEVTCHVRLHHPCVAITPEYCFVCKKKYIFAKQLQNHLADYHGIQYPDMICKICFMELHTPIEMKAHERKHNKEFNCQYCTLKFASEYIYQTHVDEHMLTLKPFECQTCGKRFANEISHNVHRNRHAKLSCLSCDLVFSKERLYLQHIKSHAPDAVKHLLSRTALLDREEDNLDRMLQTYRQVRQKSPPKKPCAPAETSESEIIETCMDSMLVAVTPIATGQSATSKLAFECKLCRAQAASAEALAEHHKARHGRSRTCPFCRTLSASLGQLQKHIATHLKARQRAQPATPPFTCNFCGKAFRSKSKWKDHLEAVHKVNITSRPFGCPICTRSFVNEPLRDKHVTAVHREEKTVETCFRCGVCGQAFVRAVYLEKHVRAVHETVHACSACEKTFDTKVALRRHVEGHKPVEQRQKYKCMYCSVCCSTGSGLRVHMRVHTDERPYACDACDLRFKRPQALRKHQLVLHRDKEAISRRCPDCPLKFYDHGNLLRHFLRIHKGLCRFVCGLCGDRFGQNHDLRRHLKMKHDTEIAGLQGIRKKSFKEIYVLPPADSVDISEEIAGKIKKAVEEEMLKFEGVSERFAAFTSSDTGNANSVPGTELEVTETDGEIIETFGNLFTAATSLPGPEASVSVEQTLESCVQSNPVESNFQPTAEQTFIGLLTRVDDLPRLYQCDGCSLYFCLESHFQDHITKRKENSCQICAQTFCDLTTFQNHLSTAHKKLPNLQMLDICYRCGICQVDFSKKDSLTEHLQDVHDVTVQFDITPEDNNLMLDLMDASQINDHGEQVASQIPITVDEISRLSGDAQLGAELPYLCPPFAAPTTLLEAPTRTFTAPTQTLTAPTQTFMAPTRTLTAPTKTLMAPNQSFTVPTQTFAVPAQLFAAAEPSVLPHAPEQITSKPATEAAADTSKKLTCAQCGKQFPEIGRLIRHINTHLGVKAHACPHCPKRFAEKHNMAVHQRTHTLERPFECGECGARLRYRQELADHAARHRGDKPHACAACGRAFLRAGELARHVRTHSQVKKFPCAKCGKAFRRVDELRVHCQVHMDDTTERPFTCAVCNKTFALRSKLSKHMALHTDRKMFICHLCGKSFALEFYLKSHLKTHTKQESYLPCTKCTRRFTTKEFLEVHLTKFHADIAKKQRKNSRAKREDVLIVTVEEGELTDRENIQLEPEVTEIEIQGELASAEGKESSSHMMAYFNSDNEETEPTYIFINCME